MKYFELTCTAYIKRDILFRDSFEKLSKYISFSMAQTNEFKELHNSNGFKFYTFNNFSPIEKSKIYKRGNSYTFLIRSFNENLIDQLIISLRENINNPNFQVIQAQKKSVKEFFISELYSITPVIVSTEKGFFWTMEKDGDIMKLYKQLHSNLERKYISLYGKKPQIKDNFIQLLEIKNRVPQTIQNHKNGKSYRFFGNKFKIVPREDELSQKLAFLALGCGLGEKNSFGGGFCIGKGK